MAFSMEIEENVTVRYYGIRHYRAVIATGNGFADTTLADAMMGK